MDGDVAAIEMTLSEALERVVAEGPELAASRARAESASGLARQSAAAWLPVVAASGAYNRTDSEVVFAFGDLLGSLGLPPEQLPPNALLQPLEVWSAAGSASVTLFAPVAWAESKAAAKSARAASLSADEVELGVQASLVAAAASAVAAEGVVAAAEQAVEGAEAHLRATRIAQQVGTATSVDGLSAQADVARRRSELVQAQANLVDAREMVGALLGVDGPVALVIDRAPPAEPGAAATRPSVLAAEAQEDAARARISAAWARHLPTLTATGSLTAQTEPFVTGRDWAGRLGVNATWVLYDGGLRYGKLEQARGDHHAAQIAAETEALRVARDQRDAERELVVVREQLALAEQQAALATEAAAVAARGLEAGTVSPLQSRDAQTGAFQAQVGVATANARLLVAEATLRRSRGLDQRW